MSKFIPTRNNRTTRDNHFKSPQLNSRYLPKPLKHSGRDHVKFGDHAEKIYKHDTVVVTQKFPDLPTQLADIRSALVAEGQHDEDGKT